MADAHKLDLVHKAIGAGILGHIQWKESAARLVRDDPDLLGLTPEGIRLLLRRSVLDGRLLDVRQETRAEYRDEWPDDPYWYRAILEVPGLPHGLFVEVKLINDDLVEPWVEIVSAHCQQP